MGCSKMFKYCHIINIFFCFIGGGYDPREMLSDAVATLVFMPTKFERTSFQLAEKFNFSVHDVNTLTVSFILSQTYNEATNLFK